ncbi:TetR/AcrR family transcriptional regulator [Gordonia sp. CPCC 205333]|uniref:TetR/AcrR family transcriptional regulator n=1 Tax=Gordonia sp. CPCC 205333 TaxID=3140790 RepID=UPI003AF36410
MAIGTPETSGSETPRRRRGRPQSVGLGDKRRQELTVAAFKVFSETSYEDAAVSSIAKEAGFGQGTLYRYVDGKRELLDMVVDWCIEKLMDVIDADELLALAEQKPSGEMVRDEIRRLGERLYALVDEYPGILKILTVQVGTVDREVKYRLTGLYATLDSLVNTLLERISPGAGVDPVSEVRRRTAGRAIPALALPGLIQVLTGEGDSPERRAAYLRAAGSLERYGVLRRGER